MLNIMYHYIYYANGLSVLLLAIYCPELFPFYLVI
jgi:hypothetical protein